MPIEFRCPSCTKLLRTPDESAGKKAKCPQCGAIVDVPVESETVAEEDAIPGGDVPRDPFARPAVPASGHGEAVNPYSAPTTISKPAKPAATIEGLRHSKVTFDDALRQSFELVKCQFWLVALCGLVFAGIHIGFIVVSGLLGGSLAAAGQALDLPVLQIVSQIFQQLLGVLVGAYYELAMINVAFRLARTGRVEVGDLFQVAPYYGRGLLVVLLRYLLVVCAAAIIVVPALLTLLTEEEVIFIPAIAVAAVVATVVVTYVTYRLYLALCFLVDRDMGVIESVKTSDQFMVGNKLTTFLVVLVASILGGLFAIFTCCLGTLVVWPYSLGIVAVTVYMLATGQPIYDPLKTASG